MTESGPWSIFVGPYFHSVSRDRPLVVENSDSVIGVYKGKIKFFGTKDNLSNGLMADYGFDETDVTILEEGHYLMPGFVDTHIHAPQFPNIGIGQDLPLMDWLLKYTFPTEAQFNDLNFAKSVYNTVVKATLQNGTTTANYYTTKHLEATQLLVEICHNLGQRAIIGHMCRSAQNPKFYAQSLEECIVNTKKLIEFVANPKYTKIYASVAPRSALCADESVSLQLSNIAKEHKTLIHTHMSESLEEIKWVTNEYPQAKTYADFYKANGVLGKNTILAHCNYLSDDEVQLLIETDTAISHCPISNIGLMSGLCPVKKYLDAGIRIGLGTDVSGGYSPSILETMRIGILTSKVLHMQNKNVSPLTYKDLFYLGTLGGAEALCLNKEIGNFEVGKKFDALLVNLNEPYAIPNLKLSSEQTIERFISLGDDRNILEVFVEGKAVKSEFMKK